MPVEYQVYDNGEYIYVKALGTLTAEEIIDYVQKIKTNPEIKEGYKELFDVRFITESKITIDSFKKIIKEVNADQNRTFRNKLAIVVSKLDSFDRAKYYERMIPMEKQNVIVFNTLETAKTWLGVDKP
jgi:hypothetical protein